MISQTKPFGLSVSAASGVPIHTQIEEQIRQAVAAGRLKAGERLPPVRALARALGVHTNTMARAFAALSRDGVIEARRGRGTFVAASLAPGLRELRQAQLDAIVARALVEAASLGLSPEEIGASFMMRLARWRADSQSGAPTATGAPNQRAALVMMGSHDLALDLLVGHLRRLVPEVRTSPVGSLAGLIGLVRGEAHVAGCHLLDEETGHYNLPFVRRVLPGVPVVVVALVGRLQGLMVPKGNPKGIHQLEDLGRRDLRFINRQKGSGTRVLLDFMLRQRALEPRHVQGYDTEADTHTGVAAAVASGLADVGLGIMAAARAFGLDLIPIRSERYDLVVLRSTWDAAPGEALRRVLSSRDFGDSVKELGGYDTSQTGTVVEELGL